MQGSLLSCLVLIFLVSRLMIGRNSPKACRSDGPVMKIVGCCFRPRPWFSFTVRLQRFVRNVGVFSRIAVAEHFVFAILSFFTSGFVNGPVE